MFIAHKFLFRSFLVTHSFQVVGHALIMRFAVRGNQPRLFKLVRTLDQDGIPIAETWRAVGAAFDKLGLTRPGYGLVRRVVRLERYRRRVRAETGAALRRAASGVAAGRAPARQLLGDLERIGWRKGLKFVPPCPP